MNWNYSFLPEAQKEFDSLDGSIRMQIVKAIDKVCRNPLPASRGGYGKPLGNLSDYSLSGLLKIKFKKIGVRAVYKLIESDNEMKIIVIALRDDNYVYKLADARRKKYGI